MSQANYLLNQRLRRDVALLAKFFDGTPGPFPMPANATVGVRATVATAAGDAATINERTLGAPALAAGQVHSLGWAERANVVTALPGYELVAQIGLGRWRKIGLAGEVEP